MDVRLTWTDCEEAGKYVVPNALSQSDLVSRPDNMDETVHLGHFNHGHSGQNNFRHEYLRQEIISKEANILPFVFVYGVCIDMYTDL